MTDQEFRALAEQWMQAYLNSIDASREYGALSAELDFTPMPRVVEHLEEATDAQQQRELLQIRSKAAWARSKALAAKAAELDVQIRAILPCNVWYRVNGKGIMHTFGVATQIMDWEEVLEKVAQ